MLIICSLFESDAGVGIPTPILRLFLAVCPSCRPTNSVKALKAKIRYDTTRQYTYSTVSHRHNGCQNPSLSNAGYFEKVKQKLK